jgi:hypothetical protein
VGRFIIKLEDRYLEWSTVCDAPVSTAMTREEFLAHYRNEYGQSGMVGLPERMARVEAKGTSCLTDDSVADTVRFNRAGPEERCLTMDELVAAYVRGGE